MSADAIVRSSVPDQVFRRLAGDVLSGRHAPGERLPTQRALAAGLGVNLASVREGLKRLEQLRLIEVRHGDAMRVRDWRSHGGLDVLVHALGGGGALDAEVMRAVMEARRLLLAEAARLAAARRDEAHAERLAALAGALAAAGGDEEAQGLDFAFFATLIEAAGNLVLLLIANSIRDLMVEHSLGKDESTVPILSSSTSGPIRRPRGPLLWRGFSCPPVDNQRPDRPVSATSGGR